MYIDPLCEEHTTIGQLRRDIISCKWKDHKSEWSMPPLKKFMKLNFARYNWVVQKKNPTGWFCAFRRPSIALAKVAAFYKSNGHDRNYLPDHLFVGDDDSYVNLEHIAEGLIKEPIQLEADGTSMEHSLIPTPNTPVVWTGCLARWPINQVNFTVGFGGFGFFQ